MDYLIDHAAKDIALRHFRGGECLHVPIAAVDVDAIRSYIGEIQQEFGRGSPPKALLVRMKDPPLIDRRYPVWELEASKVLHQPIQLWVHVGYSGYRRAYRKAFPSDDISDKILSHAMNRRVAALKGFQYTRLTPTSRSANSSSAFSEGWAVALHSSPEQMAANKKRGAKIQYADMTDLMLLLDMKLGGGVMNAVNVAQNLIDLPPGSA